MSATLEKTRSVGRPRKIHREAEEPPVKYNTLIPSTIHRAIEKFAEESGFFDRGVAVRQLLREALERRNLIQPRRE